MHDGTYEQISINEMVGTTERECLNNGTIRQIGCGNNGKLEQWSMKRIGSLSQNNGASEQRVMGTIGPLSDQYVIRTMLLLKMILPGENVLPNSKFK